MDNLIKKCIKLYKKNKEIINYLVFGGLTTVVSFVSYFLCAKLLHIDEVISNMISWVFAVTFAYITNKLWVFESKSKSTKDTITEMVQFFLGRLATGLICDIATFSLMVKVLHINDIISKLVTQVMVVILNYIFSKLVVFRKKKEIK